jgi:hypothetical protein
MEDSRSSAAAETPVVPKKRIPFAFRLVSFWLGLPVLIFVLWAWRDSMMHAAVLNWQHGSPVRMTWPQVDRYTMPALPLPEIKAPGPIPMPNEPGISGEASPIKEWNPLDEVQGFDLTALPQEKRIPLSPHYFLHLPKIGHDTRSAPLPTKVQPYRSLGSKAGSLWASSWVSPDWRRLPAWKYELEAATTGWLPALDWGHSAISRSSTIWIPYWLLTLVYLISWGGLLAWRSRSGRKRLAGLGIARSGRAF